MGRVIVDINSKIPIREVVDNKSIGTDICWMSIIVR